MRSCSESVWLSRVSVNTRNPKDVLAYWESNDGPSHAFCISFVKNSLGGIASAGDELAGSSAKKEIELQINLGLQSKWRNLIPRREVNSLGLSLIGR
jgi:hypothetical protein